MANRVVIDVETRYHDGVSAQLNNVSRSADKAKKSVEGATKSVEKLGKTKAEVKLAAKDEATSKLAKVTGAAKRFATTYKAALTFSDKASSVLGSVTGAARTFAGRTFSAGVKIIDYATSPLRKIKDMLFSIKSVIAAITMGFAAKQFVLNPINLADQYSSAKIGFSTLLGEEQANAMMNEIDQFAKATPFKTSNTIGSIQKMMAYGWDATRVIDDMKVIGDAAAATGKGDQGLESIVYALSEIRSKGKLSTQELNQLASAGIKAKAYLAEGLGFGSDDAGMAKLAKALEKGQVGANQAIDLILEGMKEFDGMMEKTANETVEGLKSQLADVFEINIARRWGQGLQDGAKKGLGSIVNLLNTAEDALVNFGDMVYDVGHELSNWAAGKLDKVVSTITKISDSDAFKSASLGGKASMLWQGAVADPLADWWENGGQAKTAETAGKIGGWLGSTLSNAILSALGVTDLLNEEFDTSAGMTIAQSFSKGFADGFDTTAVTTKLVEAVENVENALPGWAKLMLGISVGGKIAGGLLNIGGGISTAISALGSAGAGTGLLGSGALTAISLGAGNLAGGASLGAGLLSAIGLGSMAGGVAGGVGILGGLFDIFKGFGKTGKDAKNSFFTGGTKIGMVGTGAATGAALGSIIPGLGTAAGALIGGGIGGIASLFGGDKLGKLLSDWTDEGGVLDNVGGKIKTFFTETIPAKFNELLDGVGRFFTETVPYAVGFATAKVQLFFTETVPQKFGEFCDGVATFFTDTLPTWTDTVWNDEIVPFFTDTLPGFFDTLWDGITTFFTEDLPSIGSTIWGAIKGFFTDTIPGWISSAIDSASSFFGGIGEAFSKGYGAGMEGYARGGIVGGATKLIRVNEEGPEMIIPLSGQRRQRATRLWEQTGTMLGIPGFANGGLTGPILHGGATGGGGNVEINMGGVTIEIKTDGNGSLLQNIEDQEEEIAKKVAEIFKNVFSAQFANRPAKGGA